ncbi:MAG: sel1 repeat family protein [Chamaesiphon sp. CSU_1_12]|nr:sel1 repeat family protein [Chamaesiphon sp. CSU_1_12]
MKHIVFGTAIAIGIIFSQPILAQTTYPVTTQSASYPLKTQVSPALKAEMSQIYRIGKFDLDRAIAVRAKLQALADINDPEACYLLAKTYNWYKVGFGKKSDLPGALKWYRCAAELNYFPATYELYHAYFYGLMGLAPDYEEALKWLNRSLVVASRSGKAEVLFNFATFSNPDEDGNYGAISRYLPKSRTAQLAYLKRAFAADPQNMDVVGSYGKLLYEAKQYTTALQVMRNSNNPWTWLDVGTMYETGKGTKPNIPTALIWYRKVAVLPIDEASPDSANNNVGPYGKFRIYRLICLKKITPQQAKPFYTPKDYQEAFLDRVDRDCDRKNG